MLISGKRTEKKNEAEECIKEMIGEKNLKSEGHNTL